VTLDYASTAYNANRNIITTHDYEVIKKITNLDAYRIEDQTMTLQQVRDEISKLDWDIISLIAKRTKLAEEVLKEKRMEDKQINDELQNQAVLNRATENATELGLDVGEVKKIFEILIRINIEKQKELMGGGNLP